MPNVLRSSRKTPHSRFYLALYAARAPRQLSKHHSLCSLVSSMRATNPADKIRLLCKVASMLSLLVLMSIFKLETGWSRRLFFRYPIQRVRNLWCDRRGLSRWNTRELHVTQPYSNVLSTSTLSFLILSSRGALDRSYSSRVYFRKQHHALRMRRLNSIDMSLFWLTFTPRYTNSFVWLHPWPAALARCLYSECGSGFWYLFCAQTHYLTFGLRYGEARRRAHDHEHPHHLPHLSRGLRDDPGIASVKRAPTRRRQDWLYGSCFPPLPFSSSGAPKRP